ncbi:hypothetical protein B9J09_06860 [Xylella fastidiosa subsp. pauca]|uniref:Uncharacterized protein n=1 Tax=Xylella fastidiosa TaxID=2371 RepID=A0ABC8AGT7_XYLFS|nr:hypothetical protein XFHB_07405 [Xylella fastidiosa]ARO69704.1 hypothetical protein B9J09_06860 [Xylella fastidiosa subsp. pauca]ALR07754.1 hypothetical protein XFHB_07940 [Xylella fastidiosa]ALR08721.2 hypothetical protein XFFB_05255 [Xylella fastidiosa]AVI21753.1 hypothetical protein BCV75_06375 [Xylella fastidiosa]
MAELNDDIVLDIACEGGCAWIPKLAKPRRVTLRQMNPLQRERICNTLLQVLPLGKTPGAQSSVGRGDQRYYRIEISNIIQNQKHVGDGDTIILLIPEDQAPPELVQLWKEGEITISR